MKPAKTFASAHPVPRVVTPSKLSKIRNECTHKVSQGCAHKDRVSQPISTLQGEDSRATNESDLIPVEGDDRIAHATSIPETDILLNEDVFQAILGISDVPE